MTKLHILWGVLAVLVLVGGGILYIYNIEPSLNPHPVGPIVGGDRDEHGCIGSAGYSWCELKQKCLRVWEEKCEAGTTSDVNTKTHMTSWFEGFDYVNFGVNLPPDIAPTAKGGQGWLSWWDKGANKEVLLFASYEGGRGYGLKEYFDYVILAKCPKCTEKSAMSLGNISGKTYSDGVKEYADFLVAKNNGVMFHMEYPAAASQNVQNILATFWSEFPKREEVEGMELKIYLVKSNGNSEEYIEAKRMIPKASAVATAAINELLVGPYRAEVEMGYFSALPLGSRLNSLKIENGVAYADFNQQTQSGGGSTSMMLRRSQITQTLKQFPTIKSVVLSIDGNSQQDLIFQP